jgi:hypothetical protein
MKHTLCATDGARTHASDLVENPWSSWTARTNPHPDSVSCYQNNSAAWTVPRPPRTNGATRVLSQPSRRRRSIRTPRRARQRACLNQRAHVAHAAHRHAALRLLRSGHPAQHQRFTSPGRLLFEVSVRGAGAPRTGTTDCIDPAACDRTCFRPPPTLQPAVQRRLAFPFGAGRGPRPNAPWSPTATATDAGQSGRCTKIPGSLRIVLHMILPAAWPCRVVSRSFVPSRHHHFRQFDGLLQQPAAKACRHYLTPGSQGMCFASVILCAGAQTWPRLVLRTSWLAGGCDAVSAFAAPAKLHNAALPSVPGSHYAKASFGAGHRYAPCRVKATGRYAKLSKLVRSPSRRRSPFASRLTRRRLCALMAIVAPWYWSVALQVFQSVACRPVITCVPPPARRCLAATRHWPSCAGLPVCPPGGRPQTGAPNPLNPFQFFNLKEINHAQR